MSYGTGPTLRCPECGDIVKSMSAAFWHCKIEHECTGSEAYDMASEFVIFRDINLPGESDPERLHSILVANQDKLRSAKQAYLDSRD